MSAKKLGVLTIIIAVVSAIGIAHYTRVGDFAGSTFFKPDNTNQLGAEYDTIARSIRDGRGYSDPFREPSGPTAWMPPLLTYGIVALYAIFDDNREYVQYAFITLQGIAALTAGLVLLRVVRVRGKYWLVPLVFAIAMFGDFYELFQRTHDTQFQVICVSLLLWGIVRLWDRPSSSWIAVGWGVLGGLFALCGPVIGFTWAAITTLRWLPGRREIASKKMLPLLIAAIVSMAVISPWVIRNYAQFGRFIPIKSNLAYEVWQSQVLDDDGVLDSSSAYQHPWGSRSAQRIEYLTDGETRFVQKRWEPVVDSIRANPLDAVSRVANRWFAATLYYHAFLPSDENYIWPMRMKRLYFALPFLSLIVVLLIAKLPLPKELSAAILIYVLYLGPYILVSYYDRYAAPVFAIKALIVCYAVDSIRVLAFQRKLKRLAEST